MGTQTSFPVFEADQVLTNNHLNDLRKYLDEQARLTRNKLIGAGIVCGLEITSSPGSITVSKGCGLTSQGYLTLLCESAYTHCIPYTTPAFPDNIDFISQCGEPSLNKIPFYKPGFDASLLQLLTAKQLEELSATEKTNAKALGDISAQEMEQLVVVLFLEAEQIRLKNCDTNDCNDKGSRMDFEPKALLVPKSLLDEIAKAAGQLGSGGSLPHLALKRYNVPVANLLTTTAVLGAFATMADDATINQIDTAFNQCYTQYGYLFKETGNPFGGLGSRLKDLRRDIQASNLLFIQYFCDYLDDLIKAYEELSEKLVGVRSACCFDEMLFPLHLSLGEAAANTTQQTAYRQAFIYSPLFDAGGRKMEEIRFLFTKLVLLTQRFAADNPSSFLRREIKITPSRFGKAWLSDRCIPYYYTPGAVGTSPALHQQWNYKKSARGEATYSLGYNADTYADAGNLPVRQPLLYDLESYNFFRIEGHIGKQILPALTEVLRIKQSNNLPIEVIALSADYIGAILKGEDPKCVIQDLEADYRIVIAEFMCKLHDAFCSIYRFDFRPKPLLATPVLTTGNTRSAKRTAAVKAAEKELTESANTITDTKDDDDELTELISKVGVNEARIEHPVLSRLVAEAHLTKVYVKGSSLLRVCGVKKGSIGDVYLSNIVEGRFVNPISLNTNIKAASLYFRFFELIDSIESMFRILLTNELSELNLSEFKTAYDRYEKAVNNLFNQLRTITDKVQVFLTTCIIEKLQALKDEYNRRMNQYILARKFNNYFKQHGGVEHKAGVTKGGTFILVYYEETKATRFDVSALFVNKALGSLMLAKHPDLLQKDLPDADVKIATEELETAVALQCPEQYTFFNNTVKEFLAKDTTISAASREALLAAIRRPPQRATLPFASGTVIADFYVPDICCSDCTPFSYVLQPPEPQPLNVIAGPPSCNTEGTKYTVTLNVTGGTPPYTFSINNVAQTDNNIVLASGSQDTVVTVTDSAGKTTQTTVKGHTCPAPCNLPCGGASHVCHYLIWVMPPDGDNQIAHQTTKAVLTLTDEGGQPKEVDVLPVFKDAFATVQDLLTANNYGEVFKLLFFKLNEQVPENFMDDKKRMFNYDDANRLLIIDKFDCQDVSLTINLTMKLPGLSVVFVVTYDKNGTTITDARRQITTRMPPFGCRQENKCTGEKKELCTEPVSITKITGSQETFNQPFFNFKATPDFDAWFWYFYTDVPVFSGDEAPQHIQASSVDGRTHVRVIGVKKANGCFAIRDELVPLDFIVG